MSTDRLHPVLEMALTVVEVHTPTRARHHRMNWEAQPPHVRAALAQIFAAVEDLTERDAWDALEAATMAVRELEAGPKEIARADVRHLAPDHDQN